MIQSNKAMKKLINFITYGSIAAAAGLSGVKVAGGLAGWSWPAVTAPAWGTFLAALALVLWAKFKLRA